ncbi:encapsulin [Streptomyces sp. NPDC086033]|uniref:encapsulin n=1 Tax=Streptomyces sp. NPDC086033 TaxID=3365747 RepID=UPI0037D53DEC
MLDGDIVWAIDGAFLLSTRGGGFEMRLGHDVSIGCLWHDATTVTCAWRRPSPFSCTRARRSQPSCRSRPAHDRVKRRSAAAGDSHRQGPATKCQCPAAPRSLRVF